MRLAAEFLDGSLTCFVVRLGWGNEKKLFLKSLMESFIRGRSLLIIKIYRV